MFTANWTEQATADYESLREAAEKARETGARRGRKKSSKQEGLFKQADKAVRLLLSNPKHPGLHTHPYDSLEHPFDPTEKVFEAYVQNATPGAYRVFWCYGPKRKQITLIAISPHPND